MTTKLETPDQQYRRILTCLTAWREQTSLAAQAYYEAKTSECWRKHHETWKDFIEACGFTEEWGRQLALTGERISELRALLLEDSPAVSTYEKREIAKDLKGGCNSVAPKSSDSLGKLNTLTPGIRKVLDSVPLASQVEALGKTPPGKPLTVKAVKEAVKAVTPKAAEQIVSPPKSESKKPEPKVEPPKLDVDETGFVIPEKILAEWNRAREVGKRMANALKSTRLELERGIDEKDKVFGEVTNTTIAGLKLAESELRRIIPHAVCPNCSGRTPAQCGKGGLCKGRGWVSKFSYDNHLTPELKKVREKGVKK